MGEQKFTPLSLLPLSVYMLLWLFRYVVVVEHDLSVLDYLSDFICCLYGVPGAYGVVTLPSGVREGRLAVKLCEGERGDMFCVRKIACR